jgi:hypothetical protein
MLNTIGRNFNLSSDNFENGWPPDRITTTEGNSWHHSDFIYVAYPFTHKLFDKIVNDGKMK